jgi:hypothetical protein
MEAILLLEGIIMEPDPQAEMKTGGNFCPECGAEEGGYFCRSCGTLLRGEDRVLCPRCHQIVPSGDFCNQCGQTLGGIALSLRQLSLAGDDFWVTAATPAPPVATRDGSQVTMLAPDESIPLAGAELPDWLQELPTDSAPDEVKAHVYPSLRPIEEQSRPIQQGRFLMAVFVVLGLVLLALVFVVIFLLMRGGV